MRTVVIAEDGVEVVLDYAIPKGKFIVVGPNLRIKVRKDDVQYVSLWLNKGDVLHYLPTYLRYPPIINKPVVQ